MLKHICTSLCCSSLSVKENQPSSPAKVWASNIPKARKDWASASACGDLWTWEVFTSWDPSSAFSAETVVGAQREPSQRNPHPSCLLALSWTSHNHPKGSWHASHNMSVSCLPRKKSTWAEQAESVALVKDQTLKQLHNNKGAWNLQMPFISHKKIFSLVIVKFAFIKEKEIYLMTVHKLSSCALKRVIHKAVSQQCIHVHR